MDGAGFLNGNFPMFQKVYGGNDIEDIKNQHEKMSDAENKDNNEEPIINKVDITIIKSLDNIITLSDIVKCLKLIDELEDDFKKLLFTSTNTEEDAKIKVDKTTISKIKNLNEILVIQ